MDFERADRLSLQSLIRVVFAHKWISIFAFFCVAGVSFLLVGSVKPVYTAEAVLVVSPGAANEFDLSAMPREQHRIDPLLLKSETEIIGSRTISRVVIDKLALARHPEFQPTEKSISKARRVLVAIGRGIANAFGGQDVSKGENGMPTRRHAHYVDGVNFENGVEIDPLSSLSPQTAFPGLTGVPDSSHGYGEVSAPMQDALLRRYEGKLSVYNDGRSTIVRVGFTATDPVLAADVSNAHANEYIAYQVERRLADQTQALEWLRSELKTRTDDMREADARLQRFVRDSARESVQAILPGLTAEAEIKRTAYERFLDYYLRVLAEHQYSGAETYLISAALPPDRPASPKTSLLFVLGLMGACVAGISAALLKEGFQKGYKTFDELERASGVRAVGAIPKLGPRIWGFLKAERRTGSRLLEGHENQFFEESLRLIRDSLRVAGDTSEHKVIVVTSSVPKEGKSFAASALARSVATTGQPTLLIDTDMRRPLCGQLLGLSPRSVGLEDVLAQRATVPEALVVDPATNLHVLLPVRAGGDEIELVSNRAPQLLAGLRKRYKVIIIDTAPAGLVSDAFPLARCADTTIAIARANFTTIPSFVGTVQRLKSHGIDVDGFIFNYAQQSDLGPHSRHLKRYYSASETRRERHLQAVA